MNTCGMRRFDKHKQAPITPNTALYKENQAKLDALIRSREDLFSSPVQPLHVSLPVQPLHVPITSTFTPWKTPHA